MTHANIQNGHKKYGKLRAKIPEETAWNKLCIALIIPYKIRRKGKEPLSENLLHLYTLYLGGLKWLKTAKRKL